MEKKDQQKFLRNLNNYTDKYSYLIKKHNISRMELKSIIAVMLLEEVDITDLEKGIVIQIKKEKHAFIQKECLQITESFLKLGLNCLNGVYLKVFLKSAFKEKNENIARDLAISPKTMGKIFKIIKKVALFAIKDQAYLEYAKIDVIELNQKDSVIYISNGTSSKKFCFSECEKICDYVNEISEKNFQHISEILKTKEKEELNKIFCFSKKEIRISEISKNFLFLQNRDITLAFATKVRQGQIKRLERGVYLKIK